MERKKAAAFNEKQWSVERVKKRLVGENEASLRAEEKTLRGPKAHSKTELRRPTLRAVYHSESYPSFLPLADWTVARNLVKYQLSTPQNGSKGRCFGCLFEKKRRGV